MNELIGILKADPNLANAFAALVSAAMAFLAVCISIWAVRTQQRHNELSVRPLAEILVADYEDCLRVKLCNNGIGPMIITNLKVSDGASEKTNLIDWMPELPADRPWNNFAGDIRDRSLAPGSEIVLIELSQHDGEMSFAKCRDLVRSALSRLAVSVEYTNIYNTAITPKCKKLTWFGRHESA
jgi:hypothetical protein